MMLRLLSGLVLIVVFVSAIWYLPAAWLLAVAEIVLVLGLVEYARMAEALGARIPVVVSAAAAMATCAAVGLALPLEAVLAAALVAICAVLVGSRVPGPAVLAEAGAALFPVLYLGVPIGSLVALHGAVGREAVLWLLVTVIVSDTAQYAVGRLFGRHKLSPIISPKKTVEGAAGGFLVAPVAMVVAGRWWLPGLDAGWVAAIAALIVALGIAGDLFESLLKRSAGIKDSSTLIPGHGGVLDRIDGLLFAAPAFYVLVRYGQ